MRVWTFSYVHWLLTYVHDYENQEKSVPRFIFIQIELFPHPFLPQGNQVSGSQS